MSKKTIGIVLIILGVIVAVVAFAADALGIGGSPGIGWKQLLGATIGVSVALVGVWLELSKPDQKK
jgi:predicted phage tail protein